MLVLMRKPGERVVMTTGSETIVIEVVDLRIGPTTALSRVKLGFEASQNVRILREEVQEAIEAERNEHDAPPCQ